MAVQFRKYHLKPGALNNFVDVWQRGVVPLRKREGFEVVGAWVSREENVFTWVVSHPGDFTAAEQAYYRSPERARLHPDPAVLIAEAEVMMVQPVADAEPEDAPPPA